MPRAALCLWAAACLHAQPQIGGCPVFPANNAWNTAVDRLPVHADSTRYIDSIGRTRNIHPDFGSGLYEGGPIGIPFVMTPASQPGVRVAFAYADESDAGPYPIPANPPIEGGVNSTGDRHILVLQRETCRLYELFDAHPLPEGGWRAGSGAIFDLRSNRLRPSGWTSADAAGLPILPGLIRYEEVAAGEIAHAIRFTARFTRRAYVWPARHFASSRTGSEFPAMGQRFRLRAGFDESGFHRENQVVLRAMKKYGIILADNGSDWFLSGVPDERWNNERLRELRRLTGNDFEAVDVSPLIIEADSGEARQTAAARDRMVHAATSRPGVVAPGTISSLYPPEAADSVWFDGVEAELLYRGVAQLNVVAPLALRAGRETQVEARAGTRTVWEAPIPVIEAAPGIFGVLNQDFTPNTEANPAAAGSWLMIFGTGAGVAATHRVEVGGVVLDVGYAGAAPGFTPALMQLNAQIPSGIETGRQTLVWTAGPAVSPGFTVFVRGR